MKKIVRRMCALLLIFSLAYPVMAYASTATYEEGNFAISLDSKWHGITREMIETKSEGELSNQINNLGISYKKIKDIFENESRIYLIGRDNDIVIYIIINVDDKYGINRFANFEKAELEEVFSSELDDMPVDEITVFEDSSGSGETFTVSNTYESSYDAYIRDYTTIVNATIYNIKFEKYGSDFNSNEKEEMLKIIGSIDMTIDPAYADETSSEDSSIFDDAIAAGIMGGIFAIGSVIYYAIRKKDKEKERGGPFVFNDNKWAGDNSFGKSEKLAIGVKDAEKYLSELQTIFNEDIEWKRSKRKVICTNEECYDYEDFIELAKYTVYNKNTREKICDLYFYEENETNSTNIPVGFILKNNINDCTSNHIDNSSNTTVDLLKEPEDTVITEINYDSYISKESHINNTDNLTYKEDIQEPKRAVHCENKASGKLISEAFETMYNNYLADVNIMSKRVDDLDTYLLIIGTHMFALGSYVAVREHNLGMSFSEFSNYMKEKLYKDCKHNDIYKLALQALGYGLEGHKKELIDNFILKTINNWKATSGDAYKNEKNQYNWFKQMYEIGHAFGKKTVS